MMMWLFLMVAIMPLCSSFRVVDNPGQTTEMEFQTDSGPVTLIVGKKRGRSVGLFVPEPFEVTSKVMSVKMDNNDRTSRKFQKVSKDKNGVTVIHGVREPDDPNDTRVFRNARVINNILIPNSKDTENLILDTKSSLVEEFGPNILFNREGRILTGTADSEPEKKIGSTNSYRRYSAYGQNEHYDPDRSGNSGPGQPHIDSFPNEQIVGYSYSTSGQDSNRDVVYGSGSVSNPTDSSLASSFTSPFASSSNYDFRTQNIQTEVINKPSNVFMEENPFYSPFQQQAERKSSQDALRRTFSFPESDPPVLPSNQHRFSINPNAQYLSIREGTQISSPHYKHSSVSPAIPIEHFQPQIPNTINYAHSSHLAPPSNQQPIRRYQQVNSYPTPHHAFVESADNIHPGLVPANPQNFIIEEQTFQSHPGAPTFSVPVPIPSSQISHIQPQPSHQYPFYHHPSRVTQTTHYRYPQHVDRRPFIEKLMDPLRKVGQKVREAGFHFGNRMRIPERMDKLASGTVDADAIPLFGGAIAIASLGALGAYAASKYTFNDFKKLLPTTASRSSRHEVSNTLLKLANDLENENPEFLKNVVPSMKWLESDCAKRMFCSLVVVTIKEEQERLSKEKSSGSKTQTQSRSKSSNREARKLLEKEVRFFEDHINAMLNKYSGKSKNSKMLHQSARTVVDAIKKHSCDVFFCYGL